jgi:hypothetical protein
MVLHQVLTFFIPILQDFPILHPSGEWPWAFYTEAAPTGATMKDEW